MLASTKASRGSQVSFCSWLSCRARTLDTIAEEYTSGKRRASGRGELLRHDGQGTDAVSAAVLRGQERAAAAVLAATRGQLGTGFAGRRLRHDTPGAVPAASRATGWRSI